MLSPLEDIKAYLNNVNSKEYKMLRAGKEPKSGEKDWFEVLIEKLNKVMDSDIPNHFDNLFFILNIHRTRNQILIKMFDVCHISHFNIVYLLF